MPIEDMPHKGVTPSSGATLLVGTCCTTMCHIDLQLVHLIKKYEKAPTVNGGFYYVNKQIIAPAKFLPVHQLLYW